MTSFYTWAIHCFGTVGDSFLSEPHAMTYSKYESVINLKLRNSFPIEMNFIFVNRIDDNSGESLAN